MSTISKEEVIAEVKKLIEAPSCCKEAKDAAESYLKAIGTEQEKAAAEAMIAELKEDIEPIDSLLAFAESDLCKQIFDGAAEMFLNHARELKASGAEYCDCPACAACKVIIDNADAIL